MAVIDCDGAAVAADSLEVELTPAGPRTRLVRKTAGSQALVAVAGGVTRIGTVDLTTVLNAAVDEPDLTSAGRLVAASAAGMFATGWPTVRDLFAHDAVVWSVVLAGRGVDGGPRGLKLTGYREGGRLAFDDGEVTPGPGGVTCVVIGARHPWLVRHDTVIARSLDLAAELTRRPDAGTGLHVPAATAEVARHLIENAFESADVALAPDWWPAEVPVAAGPVTSAALSDRDA